MNNSQRANAEIIFAQFQNAACAGFGCELSMLMQAINFRFGKFWGVIISAIIFLNTNVVSGESIRVIDGNDMEILTVQSVSLENNQYLLVDDLLKIFRIFDERQRDKIFDAKQRYIPLTQKLTLEFGNSKKVSLVINQITVTIEGYEATAKPFNTPLTKSYTLSQPPILISGKPALPIEFLSQILAKVLDIDIEFDKNIQTLWIRLSKNDAGLEEILPFTKQKDKFLVIIDAGHGGDDVGAKSSTGLLEKNLTLEISQKLKRLCMENKINVYLTRKSDQFLTSQQRASIANINYGDLFISIHLNASFSSNQSGFTIYVNNPAGKLKLIDQEKKPETNVSEENTLTTTSSQSSQLVKKISQSDFIEQSREMAEILFSELKSAGLMGKPAIEIPLSTLNNVYMPAILFEVGYLSNASDDAKLSNPKSIETIAQALFQSVKKFNHRMNSTVSE